MSAALGRVAQQVSVAVIGLVTIACSPGTNDSVELADGGADTHSDASVSHTDAAPSGDATQVGPVPQVADITVRVTGLQGGELTLALADSAPLTVSRDGSYVTSATITSAPVAVVVASQPTSPHQLCTVTQVSSKTYAVSCTDRTWSLGGTVQGLVGSGLVLATGAGDELTVEEDGSFVFADHVAEKTAYTVTVVQQPSAPLQACVVNQGAGVASGADVSNLTVICTVTAYQLTAQVSGLVGKGLELTAQAGEPFPVLGAGVAAFPFKLPDGYAFKVDVARQPSEPDQRCYVVGGSGVLHADAGFEVHCDMLGGLRITEVGACPYLNSACWFELTNASDVPETLSDFRVRTSSLAASVYAPDRTFDLPDVALPPGATMVLQARTSTQPDGSNVYHVADGAALPWWPTSGFVELLNKHGATQDFVRFGDSQVEPTTGGTWAGGAVPALPSGPAAYGYSVAHTQKTRAVSSAADWRLSAFATYGGPNDVSSDTDLDADGIPDVAEIQGGHYAGLDLYAMGARANQRDVFVEIDRMDSNDPAVIPRRGALDKVVASFAKRGIVVHFDAGSLFSVGFDPSGHNLGGGNKVPFAKAVGFDKDEPGIASLYDYKAEHMDGARRALFYYMLFGWSQEADGSGGSSGVGELPGNDSIITLGGFDLSANTIIQRNLLTNYQAATMMHELGHNFGLRHGGSDSRNLKPNYVSVMNYLYSPLGLPTIGKSEGDRYDLYRGCSLYSVLQLQNPPSGDTSDFVLDYSEGLSADLDEHSIVEREGLGRTTSSAVDYNCNKKVDSSSYGRDLNDDKVLEVLSDNNDWASLEFVFRRTVGGAENGRALRLQVTHTHGDVLTADEEHAFDPPCPKPILQ